MSLVFDKVSYSYPNSNGYALKDVSFSLENGTFLGIIGHTGSGKTTLAQMINALISPTSGKVLIDGEDINASKASKRAVKSKVGLVFQYPDYQLFANTVERDIAFGPMNLGLNKDEVWRRINAALKIVGFKPDEILPRNPFELSGGQKRRLAIAEALVMKPKYLVMDEPTAGLDPRGRAALLKLLRSLKKDKVTVIMVSHNMEDVAELCDELLVLKDGAVVMHQSPHEVFKHAKELRAINLGVPIETTFATELIDGGIPMPECVISYNELVDSIVAAFKGTAAFKGGAALEGKAAAEGGTTFEDETKPEGEAKFEDSPAFDSEITSEVTATFKGGAT